MADSLSRDFALSDKEVTKLIRRHCSPLVPQSFRIIPLTGTIISRIGELLRRLPSTKLLPTQPTPSAIAAGATTNASSSSSGVDSILFSDSSDNESNSKPLPASPPRLERDDWTPTFSRLHSSLGRNCSCRPQRCGSDLLASPI